MNEQIVAIEYWVNEMLPAAGNAENSLHLPNIRVSVSRKRFRFLISIHLTAEESQPTEESSVSLSYDEKLLVNRQLTRHESLSILQKISCLKLSFTQPSDLGSISCPSIAYGLRIRRGTALMEFSWADGQYITSDKALLDSLTNLVIDISKLESVKQHEMELGIVSMIY